jgi:glycosyltransferase involved in cell wall biosynthesis
VGRRPEDRAYLESVRSASRGLPVEIHADAPEATVRSLRQKASLCWHAAGHGESATAHPERYEHFGIAVAELMVSGVAPVAIDGGGLREIVTHGETGFRWRRRDELAAYTLRLVRDARLREAMGRAARERANQWSVAAFQRRVVALVERVWRDASQAAGRPA